ncbi:hypothetical protein KJZ99_00165 [bacterium]|nr:hypothetical protein [bacterium]
MTNTSARAPHTRLDVERIKRESDVVRVLRALGFTHARYGPNFKCVFGTHDDKHPSCHAYPRTNTVKCFSCGESADVFALVQRVEGADFPTAVRRVAEICNIVL